jgi:hypothetical protein
VGDEPGIGFARNYTTCAAHLQLTFGTYRDRSTNQLPNYCTNALTARVTAPCTFLSRLFAPMVSRSFNAEDKTREGADVHHLIPREFLHSHQANIRRKLARHLG